MLPRPRPHPHSTSRCCLDLDTTAPSYLVQPEIASKVKLYAAICALVGKDFSKASRLLLSLSPDVNYSEV